jgi:hypothetical protein
MGIKFTEKEINLLQCWFGIRDGGLQPLEEAYLNNDCERLYELTQEYYNSEGNETLHLYRWEPKNASKRKRVLQSWSTDKNTAKSYKNLRGEGELIEKDFPVKQVFFTTDIDYVAEWDIYWDILLGMYPMQECIVMKDGE